MTEESSKPPIDWEAARMTVELKSNCCLCVFFGRASHRQQPTMMAVLRLPNIPDAKGLAICRACWKDGAELMKRAKRDIHAVGIKVA